MKHSYQMGTPIFWGVGDFVITSTAKYDNLTIAEISQTEQFKSDLSAHQQGKSDYLTFCNQCAASGIEKWVVNMEKMSCAYYDKMGNEILMERIPAIS